jgi:hypothetical protein
MWQYGGSRQREVGFSLPHLELDPVYVLVPLQGYFDGPLQRHVRLGDDRKGDDRERAEHGAPPRATVRNG